MASETTPKMFGGSTGDGIGVGTIEGGVSGFVNGFVSRFLSRFVSGFVSGFGGGRKRGKGKDGTSKLGNPKTTEVIHNNIINRNNIFTFLIKYMGL